MDDDKAMEDLFREILASPQSTSASLLPLAGSSASEMMSVGFGSGVSGGVNEEGEKVEGAQGEEKKNAEEGKSIITEIGAEQSTAGTITAADWENEIEIQRILDTMMTMSSSGEGNQLDMGLGMEFVTPENTLGYELGIVGLDNLGFDMDFASVVGSSTGQSWDTGVF